MKRVTILILIVGFAFAGISPVLAQPRGRGAKLDKDKGAKPDEGVLTRTALKPASEEAVVELQ